MFTEQDPDIYQAKIYLSEARKRRQGSNPVQQKFAHVLLSWAACSRWRYVANRIIAARSGSQGELF